MATSSVQVMEITMAPHVSSPALVAMSCKEAQLEYASTIWGGQEWSQPVHVSILLFYQRAARAMVLMAVRICEGGVGWNAAANFIALEVRSLRSLSPLPICT